ncbi:MAG: phosphate acetyltransferase [Bacilli bacterium]
MLLNEMKKAILNKGIRIVLPEGDDLRVLQAAVALKQDNLVQPIFVGDVNNIKAIALKNAIKLDGIEMIDINTYEKFDEMVLFMSELRQGKQTKEECAQLLKQSNYFGTLLVKMGLADGLVGGATYSTADTVRPALQLIKTKPGNKTVSSSFVMYKDDEKYIFGDCAIIVTPTSSDLVEIAMESAKTARIFGIEPHVALLSFSTKGSGKGGNVAEIANAAQQLESLNVDFKVDGELQFDAAIDASVAQIKAPQSQVAGHANVFVFPSLEAGNIGYKIAQRLGGFNALGPILQGLNAPINDLSRGCNSQDVYELCIVSAAQSLN